jgi:hypothetical protein
MKPKRNKKNKTNRINHRSGTQNLYWSSRGRAFIALKQENLEEILDIIALSIKTGKDIEKDLRKGLRVVGEITSEIDKFVTQGIEQREEFRGFALDTKEDNLALIEIMQDIVIELKENNSIWSSQAEDIKKELELIQHVLLSKDLKQIQSMIKIIHDWKLSKSSHG